MLEAPKNPAIPLPGPAFVIAVDDQRVRIETPLARLELAEARGDEAVLQFSAGEFLHVLMGLDGGREIVARQDVPQQVQIYAERLFPNTGYQYWAADTF